MAKKVVYGLKELHYAVETDNGSALSYGNPVAIVGAVNWTCTPRIEDVNFEADNDDGFFRNSALKGFDIEVEVASIPEEFLTNVMGQTKNTAAGTIVGNVGDTIKRVALMGMRTKNIDGVENSEYFVIYHALPSIPKNLDAQTSANKSPKSQTISFKSDANPYSGNTHATTTDTDGTAKTQWFTTVYQP